MCPAGFTGGQEGGSAKRSLQEEVLNLSLTGHPTASRSLSEQLLVKGASTEDHRFSLSSDSRIHTGQSSQHGSPLPSELFLKTQGHKAVSYEGEQCFAPPVFLPLSGQPTNVDNSDGHEHQVGTGSTMDRKRVMDRGGNRWEGVAEVPLLCNLSFYLRRHSYKN